MACFNFFRSKRRFRETDQSGIWDERKRSQDGQLKALEVFSHERI